ncbi:MAG: hypothetical protein K2N23_01220 [Clostridia bacterium]|nr:hypothetical protein [Clostridia bacterium]
MFTLITDRSRYFKIKRGQSSGEVENVLNTPVCGKAFAGRVIRVSDERLIKITAGVGDNYRTIAAKYGVAEPHLKEINGSRPVYPTCKIFVPKK